MLTDVPLVVDLDGSLIRTDCLWETLFLFLKKRPFLFWKVPWLMVKGRTVLKQNLFEETNLQPEILPYNEEVVNYIRTERDRGRQLIICSGSWKELVSRISDHLGLFDQVIATESGKNLTGSTKAEVLVERFGEKGFDYLGNESKDLAVWQRANAALVVGDERLLQRANSVSSVTKHFVAEPASFSVWLRAIRVHQWAKNALLFVPLLGAHQYNHFPSIVTAVVAFLFFSLSASATYLLNDMLDLTSDRRHSTKKSRPIASGKIPISFAFIISIIMICVGVGGAVVFVNFWFVIALCFYLAVTVFYSFFLKSLHTVDVISLATLFTTRVVSGAFAIEVTLSFWLLCFSMFIFLSLALVKRVSELLKKEKSVDSPIGKIEGRGYFPSDVNMLQCLGCISGFMAVLVFALYINSPEIRDLYRHPEVLWSVIPILSYWIMRIWIMTARNEIDEDPISFAITDKNSLLVGLLVVLSVLLAGS